MSSFRDMPGDLGATRGFTRIIHQCDWPTYPQGEDYKETLLSLTAFPVGTSFGVIDNCERAILMVADQQSGKVENEFSERHFHISAWYEDLIELQGCGYIEGVQEATKDEWERARWDKMISRVPEGRVFSKSPDGRLVEIQPPPVPAIEEEDEEFPEYKGFVITPHGHINMTRSGREHALTLIRESHFEIGEGISQKVDTIYKLGFFDTAVREACVQLEHELKEAIGSKAYGEGLIRDIVASRRMGGDLLESAIRAYRQELRSVFKLIRNDVAHNLRDLDEIAAYSNLFRIARVRSFFGF